MTEITRETLELAALAAGHTITSFEPVGPRGALVAIIGVNAAGPWECLPFSGKLMARIAMGGTC